MHWQTYRRPFQKSRLSDEELPKTPFVLFKKWFDLAISEKLLDAEAMTLCTVMKDDETSQIQPYARMVYLKAYSKDGFIFFTGYQSHKAMHIAWNPVVSLHFYWGPLEKQVAILGTAQKTHKTLSERYHKLRPRKSQIAAHAFIRPCTASHRQDLEDQYAKTEKQWVDQKTIPCPKDWGGYLVTPHRFEFWQGREHRIHDRIIYQKEKHTWHHKRQSP